MFLFYYKIKLLYIIQNKISLKMCCFDKLFKLKLYTEHDFGKLQYIIFNGCKYIYIEYIKMIKNIGMKKWISNLDPFL